MKGYSTKSKENEEMRLLNIWNCYEFMCPRNNVHGNLITLCTSSAILSKVKYFRVTTHRGSPVFYFVELCVKPKDAKTYELRIDVPKYRFYGISPAELARSKIYYNIKMFQTHYGKSDVTEEGVGEHSFSQLDIFKKRAKPPVMHILEHENHFEFIYVLNFSGPLINKTSTGHGNFFILQFDFECHVFQNRNGYQIQPRIITLAERAGFLFKKQANRVVFPGLTTNTERVNRIVLSHPRNTNDKFIYPFNGDFLGFHKIPGESIGKQCICLNKPATTNLDNNNNDNHLNFNYLEQIQESLVIRKTYSLQEIYNKRTNINHPPPLSFYLNNPEEKEKSQNNILFSSNEEEEEEEEEEDEEEIENYGYFSFDEDDQEEVDEEEIYNFDEVFGFSNDGLGNDIIVSPQSHTGSLEEELNFLE